MALKFADSWKNYATADLLRMWTQVHGTPDSTEMVVASGVGRRGGNAFRVEPPPSGARRGLGRVVVPATTTALLGFAFKGGGSAGGWGTLTTVASGGNSLNMVNANAGALDVTINTLASIRNSYYTQVALSINSNGTISMYRGNADSLGGGGLQGQDRIAATLGTTTQALLYDQWYYIELQVVVHPTAGSAQLRVNGETWLNVAGVRTQADGASSATAWQEAMIAGHLGAASTTYWYYEDLYLADTDLSDAFNQWAALVGDVAINYSNVFQDGAMIDWSVLSGSDHFAMVDDNPPDLDVTYNHTDVAGEIDTFLKTAVPVVGKSVIALVPIYLVRRVEGGNTESAAVIRDGGGNFSGSKLGSGTAVGNTTSYSYDWWAVTQRPSASGTALTQTLVDAMEVGYRKVT